jgi:hypothetical protein
MNLSGGSNIVQPSGGGGGGFKTFLNFILQNQAYAQVNQNRKDLATHQGQVRVATETAIFDHKAKNSFLPTLHFSKGALKELPKNHPDRSNPLIKPHPVTQKYYKDPVTADHYIKASARFASGGLMEIGPGIGGINQAIEISGRSNTRKPKQPKGKNWGLNDTQDALNKGFIHPEEAAEYSSAYRKRNPNINPGAVDDVSEKDIKRVNSNLDKLPKPEIK